MHEVQRELRDLRREIDSRGGRSPVSPLASFDSSGSMGSLSAAQTARQSLRIAVLPFTTVSGDAEALAFADSLGEDITAGLGQFRNLSVVARSTTERLGEDARDRRLASHQLGARYLLDGSERRSATPLRTTLQLVDAQSGVPLWSETYTRDLSSADVFAIQDDVTDRVVATVADVHGMLMGSMQQSIRDVPIERLTSYELLLRCWAYHRQPTRDEHARLREAFERMTVRQPHDPDVWAALATLYGHEHSHWFNPQPDPLPRARQLARHAIELDPVGQLGWEALAVIFFFERDAEGFHMAVDRAIALNPRSTNTLAWMALLLGHHGEAARAQELVTRAMRLNPHHPGWYHFVLFDWHYRRDEFAEALATARRVNTPDLVWMHIVIANTCGRLGRAAEARAALKEMRALEPAFVHDAAVEEATRRWFWDPGLAEQMMIGFRAARAFEAKTT
jgi:TolB-like protein